jgi:hypothetical protein
VSRFDRRRESAQRLEFGGISKCSKTSGMGMLMLESCTSVISQINRLQPEIGILQCAVH